MIVITPNIRYQSIAFGYSSKLKDLYRQGKLEGLKSFSGEELKHPSIDHIKPKSKGGKNILGNYVLTNCKENSLRGDKNIDYYIENNEQGMLDYIKWFETHKVPGFDCIGYIRKVINTINNVSEKFIIINMIK
jgi:hypothetical protein